MRKLLVLMALVIGAVSWFFLAGKAVEPLSFPSKTELPQTAVFKGAKVFTSATGRPWADTIIVKNGKFTFVGAEEDAVPLPENAVVFDLDGQFILPGLIDSHTHPGLVAALGDWPDEAAAESELDTSSKEAFFKSLRQMKRDKWMEPLIVAGFWDVDMFLPDGPNKEDLDEIFPLKPVILFDNSGHSFWLNSSALWLLGIDRDTLPLSENISYFAKDENGEPTGWAKEFAMLPALGDSLLPSEDEFRNGMVRFLSELSALGVTSVWDAGNFDAQEFVYRVVHDLDTTQGLPLRYEASYHIWRPDQIDDAIPALLELRDKYQTENLRFNSVKIHYDGVLEVLTAGMLEPYAGTEDNVGGILFPTEMLAEFIEELEAEGINLHMHTVGDWATQSALDAINLATRMNGEPLSIKIALAHLEQVADSDFERFPELNVFANFTPHWFGGDVFGDAGVTNLGLERAHHSQQAGSFVKAGASITLSSDVTTRDEAHRANPFIGLEMAVTRQDYNSVQDTAPGYDPEALTIEQALLGYTIFGAQQLGVGEFLGSIEVGKQADFVILRENATTVPVSVLSDVKPVAVVQNGRLVHGTLH